MESQSPKHPISESVELAPPDGATQLPIRRIPLEMRMRIPDKHSFPWCSMLAGISPLACVIVPFWTTLTNEEHGSFAAMIATVYGAVGGVVGIILSIPLVIFGIKRKERVALFSTLSFFLSPFLFVIIIFILILGSS